MMNSKGLELIDLGVEVLRNALHGFNFVTCGVTNLHQGLWHHPPFPLEAH